MSIELFTTVLPLIILGFGYLSGSAGQVSVGNLFVRQLGLTGSSEQNVRAAFGTSGELRSSWTVVGLAGFLIWGIPMAITVAGISPRPGRENGARGKKFLAQAEWAGVVIDGILIALATRIFFPPMLTGWTNFGPIGVAMALMTWCGVLGFGWVITACISAVMWERAAPISTVIAAESEAGPATG